MDKCVEFLRRELEQYPEEDDQEKRDEIYAHIRQLIDALVAFQNCDDKAVDRAVSGASFVHPRLTAIAVKTDLSTPTAITEINSNMTVEEKQKAYAERLKHHGPNI